MFGRSLLVFLLTTATPFIAPPATASETAQEEVISPTLAMLRRSVARGDQLAVDAFWREVRQRGTPLVEAVPGRPNERLVTFLYRGSPNTRNVIVRINGTSMLADPRYFSRATLAKLEGTDVWSRTFRMRSDARFPYQLSPNDALTLLSAVPPDQRSSRLATFIADPLNPRHFDDRDGDSSLVELPDAPAQPSIDRHPGVAAGTVERIPFTSKVLENQRPVFVYLPAGYARIATPAALLVTTDGESYVDRMRLVPTLDNLIGRGKIPPTVAVMVGSAPADRVSELLHNLDFNRFLRSELMPWIRSRYRVDRSPARTVIAGSSIGGNAALFAALEMPDLFGNVIAQSAGFMNRHTPAELAVDSSPGPLFESGYPESEWLTRQFAGRPKLPLRLYIEAGLMEDMDYLTAPPRFAYPSLLLAARHLRDVLQAKGYAFCYHEFNGPHEPLNWRGTLADALVGLLATQPQMTDDLCVTARRKSG